MFAPTPTMSSIKVAITIAMQNDWPLYDFDVSCSGKTRRRRLHEISVRLRGEDRKGGSARPRILRDKAGRSSAGLSRVCAGRLRKDW